MADGPGKYDPAATMARLLTGADGVVLIVINGSQGNGFSVQVITPLMLQVLPSLLRDVATRIETENPSSETRH